MQQYQNGVAYCVCVTNYNCCQNPNRRLSRILFYTYSFRRTYLYLPQWWSRCVSIRNNNILCSGNELAWMRKRTTRYSKRDRQSFTAYQFKSIKCHYMCRRHGADRSVGSNCLYVESGWFVYSHRSSLSNSYHNVHRYRQKPCGLYA